MHYRDYHYTVFESDKHGNVNMQLKCTGKSETRSAR